MSLLLDLPHEVVSARTKKVNQPSSLKLRVLASWGYCSQYMDK